MCVRAVICGDQFVGCVVIVGSLLVGWFSRECSSSCVIGVDCCMISS